MIENKQSATEDDFFGDDSSSDEAPPNNRSGARQVALQALYWQASSSGEANAAVDELCQRFALSKKTSAFANELVSQVNTDLDSIDALIAETSTRWSPERIARVDRLILRLALAEILHIDDVPPRVSISEAVNLAKAFSTEKSYAFVNGILDAIARRKGLTN
jgi:N utilization substance protein B